MLDYSNLKYEKQNFSDTILVHCIESHLFEAMKFEISTTKEDVLIVVYGTRVHFLPQGVIGIHQEVQVRANLHIYWTVSTSSGESLGTKTTGILIK